MLSLVIDNALAPHFTASVPYAETTDAVLEIERCRLRVDVVLYFYIQVDMVLYV